MTEQHFPAAPRSVPAARRFIAEALAGLPPEELERAELIVSELASNAILHGGSPFSIRVERVGERVRVFVADRGGGTPVPQRPARDELHGRGLQIVEALAARWGVGAGEGRGKTVWFTLGGGPLPPRRPVRP